MPQTTDPLIATLPPATDYITYLTILEYQLTPSRLPTLTRLISEDDGTLAKEIGWDLVQLILRILSDAPRDAAECLEVVARRGNPREVVIRVAEALESLGGEEGEDSGSDQVFDDEDEDEDSLRTFKGEAERIHLGNLTLEGGPPDVGSRAKEPTAAASEPAYSKATLQFQTLISMLSILHPRIKTKYPSRFLATSLPAALGAYRRIRITSVTTSAFLTFLGKVSGKQRPELPPRNSTAAVSQFSTTPTRSTDVASVTLPDPEAQSETEPQPSPSKQENDIMLRLIQAVTLEVLDEYVLSLTSDDPNCMSWTVRLREKFQPKRVNPTRQTETSEWEQGESLKERTATIAKFLSLSRDLYLDAEEAFRETYEVWAEGQSAESDITVPNLEEDDTASHLDEFPTTPSQIPFPPFGVLFLFAAQQTTLNLSLSNPCEAAFNGLDIVRTISHLFKAFTARDVADTGTLSHNPVPVLDALLAVLYIATHLGKLGSCTSEDFETFFIPLVYLCVECHDQHIRDSAHAVATQLLHQYPDARTRFDIIIKILRGSPATNLAGVAVEWLKDEILAANTTTVVGTPLQEPAVHETKETATTSTKPNPFANPSLLSNGSLLPLLLATPTDDNDVDVFVLGTPFYISSLNLLYLILSRDALHEKYQPRQQLVEEDGRSGREVTVVELLDRLDAWIERVKALPAQEEEEEGLHEFELWSLEDAFQRVKKMLIVPTIKNQG